MPLLKEQRYTAKDYWNLPEGERAELIDGKLYAMAPPSYTHQRISFALSRKIADYIDTSGGSWIVDPIKEHTVVYYYEEDFAPNIFPFNETIPVGIYKNLKITISDLL